MDSPARGAAGGHRQGNSLSPKLLIADEPTSALDPSVQARILKLLMNLLEKMGLAIIFITYDIALARKVSDQMAVMHKGRIVEAGATNEILIQPQHHYTRRLVNCAGGRYEKEDGEIDPVEESITIKRFR
jgi:peptide/nickel transport system ATP-binding protein